MRHPSGQNWQDDLSLQPSYWIWVIALPGQGEQSLNINLFRAMTCARVLFVHIPSFDSLQPWWGWPGQELWSWFDGWENFGSEKLSVCEGQRLGQNPGFSVPRPELLFFVISSFFFFFWYGPFLKSLLNVLQHCLCCLCTGLSATSYVGS